MKLLFDENLSEGLVNLLGGARGSARHKLSALLDTLKTPALAA